MKDEIKEMLNNADSSTKFKMVDEDGTEKEMNIAGVIEQLLNDNSNLLDYITNLQEENEKNKEYSEFYKDMSDKWEELSSAFKKSCEDYKTRNEKVISYIDSLFNTIDYDDEEFITFDTLESIQNLAKYGQLQGKSDE